MQRRSLIQVCTVLTLFTLCLQAAVRPVAAQATGVTVAWDPNAEPEVSGYLVYVSHEGIEDTFDAGRATVFTLPSVHPATAYVFTVAAYTSAGLIGPRSNAVFYLAGADLVPSLGGEMVAGERMSRASAPMPGEVSRGRDVHSAQIEGQVSLPARCSVQTPVDCYEIVRVFESREPITGVAAFPDDGIAVIVDARRLLLMNAAREVRIAFETVSDEEVLTAVAPYPDFARTRLVEIERAERRPDGSGEIQMTRGREVAGILGELSTFVAGVVSPTGKPGSFVVLSDGRVILARGETLDSYTHDGRRAEPPMATAWQQGSRRDIRALAWNARTATLLLSDADALRAVDGGSESVTLDSETRSLVRVRSIAGRSAQIDRYPVPEGVIPIQVSLDQDGRLLLVAVDSEGVYQVLSWQSLNSPAGTGSQTRSAVSN